MAANKSANMTNKILVYVTGFGPFSGHEEKNASWEAVQLLPSEHIIDNQFIAQIVRKEIPVVYSEVDKAVDEIWSKHPQLVIHCGVHGKSSQITLEKQAYNNKFCKPDWTGKLLKDAVCTSVTCPEEVLHTNLVVDRIANELNASVQTCDNMYCCSTDPGNYLCCYIYLKSLDQDKHRTLFVHVPPIDQPFSSQETANAILQIVEKCVWDLHEKNILV